jgi:hypothetical protein
MKKQKVEIKLYVDKVVSYDTINLGDYTITFKEGGEDKGGKYLILETEGDIEVNLTAKANTVKRACSECGHL